MRKIHVLVLLLVLVSIAGCGCLEPYMAPDGTLHTKFGDTANLISGAAGGASKVLPLPLSAAVSLFGSVAGLIGFAVNSVVAKRKESGTLEAVIRGIELAGNQQVKEIVRKVAGDLGYQPHLKSLISKYIRKDQVQNVS